LRKGLVADVKKAGLDPAKIVVHGGAGLNFGGMSGNFNRRAVLKRGQPRIRRLA
jgi:hypothetical protein